MYLMILELLKFEEYFPTLIFSLGILVCCYFLITLQTQGKLIYGSCHHKQFLISNFPVAAGDNSNSVSIYRNINQPPYDAISLCNPVSF